MPPVPKVTPLKIAIVSSGQTMKQIAQRIGRHEDEVSKWANDARPVTRSTKIALAGALDTTVDALWPDDAEHDRVAA